jgi:serine/threonine/tyrosine-interacting protein
MVLPFLYLAPYQAAKDRKFLESEGITMLLGVRERKSAAYMNPKALTTELGIKLVVTNVASHQELIAALPDLINTINNHLLQVYEKNETVKIGERKIGKVVLFCESGNERSAGVATAYLMSMYAFDLATAVQTIQGQRFCVTFDDSLKQWLLNYESILVARRQVEAASVEVTGMRMVVERGGSADPGDRTASVGASGGSKGKGKQKRVLMDVYDEEGDTEMGGTGSFDVDGDRFKEREDWVPFGDKS